jgi:hypothetical protein
LEKRRKVISSHSLIVGKGLFPQTFPTGPEDLLLRNLSIIDAQKHLLL